MKMVTGTVVGGKVEFPDESVADGTSVVVLAPESREPVRLSPEEEQELLNAYEEIRRGEYVEAEDLLAELRRR